MLGVSRQQLEKADTPHRAAFETHRICSPPTPLAPIAAEDPGSAPPCPTQGLGEHPAFLARPHNPAAKLECLLPRQPHSAHHPSTPPHPTTALANSYSFLCPSCKRRSFIRETLQTPTPPTPRLT
ncbi:unnamed protein product [Rangifer tarandus platyrhynchus]|uniref:Uncharacterized protein n=2 Tax=Rangifer tarandus platyrhynchus TaxID=3082113 RepID=A0ABN8Y362_RANTA|nr:unnamed protein product [Rangifer tarandus platyrhynchus]